MVSHPYLRTFFHLVLLTQLSACPSLGSPEQNAECIENQNDCDAGQVCVEYKCVFICDTTIQCEPGYICIDQTCQIDGRACLNNTSCEEDEFCNNQTCTAKYLNGIRCTDESNCVSGFCVDGVCCNTPCEGTCLSCDSRYTTQLVNGVCDYVTKGLDDKDECTGELACDGEGACYRKEIGEACSENYECISNHCHRSECRMNGCGDGFLNGDEECDDGNSSNTDQCTNECRNAQCGDGFIRDGNEQCDNGSALNSNETPDACRENCVLPSCGDGVVDTNEVCDTGSLNQDHYADSSRPCNRNCSSFAPHCGDGILNGDEECDHGDSNSDAHPNSCSTSCLLPYCGNGVIDQGEECDEAQGNNTGITCNTSCLIPRCGNGFIDLGEDCDDGNSDSNDSCLNTCLHARCGDGFIWTGVEECEDGNSSNTDSCLNNCLTATCGDGHLWMGHEQCDDGNRSSNDYCTSSCSIARCGDSQLLIGHEECDDGNTSNEDACLNSCLLATCGDGFIQIGSEECEPEIQPYCSAECISQIFHGDVTLDFQSMQNSSFDGYRKIAGNLTIDNLDLTHEPVSFYRLTMPNLEEITGSLSVHQTTQLFEIDLPELKTVGGDFKIVAKRYFPGPLTPAEISYNQDLSGVLFPQLSTVGGIFEISENPRLNAINFESLRSVESVYIGENPSLCINGLFFGNSFPQLPNSEVHSGNCPEN